MKNIVEIYCLADDLVKFMKKEAGRNSKVGRPGNLSKAEYITLAIMKQEYGIRTNKKLYNLVKYCTPRLFSELPSYAQFNEGLNATLPHLFMFLQIWMQINKAHGPNVYYVDSTTMPICANAHRYRVKVDLGLASSGKNIYGWFYGFKMHLIINYNMEIVSIKFTTGSTSDIKALDEKLTKELMGILIGDKGYISAKKKKELAKQGLILMTKPRKNMPHTPATILSIMLLRSWQRIESVFGNLKHNLVFVNRYARSLTGYFAQAIAALVTYCIQKNENNACMIGHLLTDAISWFSYILSLHSI